MNLAGNVPLAIVIPAYKTKYLRATLQSIVNQTDQRFRLYVGDDASPEPVETVVREFAGKISLHYQRFNDNLGKKSLVGHWVRCLNLTTEPWLWIFSDDDLLEPGCVAAFYAELARTQGQHDAYRFNAIVEQTASRFPGGGSWEKPSHPPRQSGRDFLCGQLRGPHNSYMQEVIFSRTAWQRVGIPDFPLAWFADDAFIASLGEPRPLCTLAAPRIHWRWSDDNITGSNSRSLARVKFHSAGRFVQWAIQFLTAHGMESCAAAELTERWYYHGVLQNEMFLDRQLIQEMQGLARQCWGRTAGRVFAGALALNSRLLVNKISGRLRRWRASS